MVRVPPQPENALAVTLRRLSRKITAGLQAASSNLAHIDGVVTAISSSGTLTVTLNGGDVITCGYYAPQPAVGDTVGVLLRDNSPIVLGSIHGLPS